ncbi:hypothetical protein MC885_014483 [Smutsia gigantea]|nr:hypothetical protein MC885_014483 [Smutsia gigantea]
MDGQPSLKQTETWAHVTVQWGSYSPRGNRTIPPCPLLVLCNTGGTHKGLIQVVREVNAFTHLSSNHREEQGPCQHASRLATALKGIPSPGVVEPKLGCHPKYFQLPAHVLWTQGLRPPSHLNAPGILQEHLLHLVCSLGFLKYLKPDGPAGHSYPSGHGPDVGTHRRGRNRPLLQGPHCTGYRECDPSHPSKEGRLGVLHGAFLEPHPKEAS